MPTQIDLVHKRRRTAIVNDYQLPSIPSERLFPERCQYTLEVIGTWIVSAEDDAYVHRNVCTKTWP